MELGKQAFPQGRGRRPLLAGLPRGVSNHWTWESPAGSEQEVASLLFDSALNLAPHSHGVTGTKLARFSAFMSHVENLSLTSPRWGQGGAPDDLVRPRPASRPDASTWDWTVKYTRLLGRVCHHEQQSPGSPGRQPGHKARFLLYFLPLPLDPL